MSLQTLKLKNEKKKKTSLETLREKLAALATEAGSIEADADAEGRALSAEELTSLKEIKAKFTSIEEEIAVREGTADLNDRLEKPGRRLAAPADLDDDESAIEARSPITGAPVGATKGNWGFTNGIGEWAIAAYKTKAGAEVDNRIMNAPSTYGAEGVNQDGGFALPPDFRADILKLIMGEESLLSKCSQMITESNAISLPMDSTTPWQTSGGVIGGWIAEGAGLSASKPQLKLLTCKLNKVGALVPVTDELLEDVPLMTKWIQSKVPEKFNSMINDAIVAGSGAGQPQGLLNSPAKITQAAVSGQGAGTIVAKNVLAMWGRMYGPYRTGAVWIINQDCEQQLQQLVMPGTNPSLPVYMPPGGFSAQPYATLLGRPIIVVEACKALGTEGDIILTNLQQYLAVMKSTGLRQDVSIHLYFDSDHTAFRFIMRVGGQTYLDGAITRQNGSNTLSSVVTLNSTRT
jgi:HK97 family phage major capsid protein